MTKKELDFKQFNFQDITNEYGDLSTTAIYFGLFKELPNYITDENPIDIDKFKEYMERSYKKDILYTYFGSEIAKEGEKKVFAITYILTGSMIIRISDHRLKFYFRDEQDKRIEDIRKKATPYKAAKVKEDYISFILSGSAGLKIVDSKLAPRQVILEDNYNDDLLEKSKDIVKHLGEQKSGIYLFHGDAGGGKSSYIRWLKTQTEKKFIFMPINVAAGVDSPELLGLMMNNEGSVLIIEDAEKLIKSREGDQNSTIASLLNLSDGLIGQTLNIQVICTFNTHLSKIDKALLRKGRLLDAYEFKKLSLDKTQKLFKKLGHKGELPKEPMILTDIFNYDQEDYALEKKDKIGFITA